MDNTFKKELTFLEKGVDVVDGVGLNCVKSVTKLALFRELSQTDKSQRGLIFLMRPLYEVYKGADGENRIVANPQIFENLTTKCIDDLLILKTQDNPIESLNIQEKTEFLNDNFAVLAFAEWFLNEKLTPFFLPYLTGLTSSTKVEKTETAGL
jgi:hypothetical protein